jgi:hypothetical protein
MVRQSRLEAFTVHAGEEASNTTSSATVGTAPSNQLVLVPQLLSVVPLQVLVGITIQFLHLSLFEE